MAGPSDEPASSEGVEAEPAPGVDAEPGAEVGPIAGVVRGAIRGSASGSCQVALRPIVSGEGDDGAVLALAQQGDVGAEADSEGPADPVLAVWTDGEEFVFSRVAPGSYDLVAVCGGGSDAGYSLGLNVVSDRVVEQNISVAPMRTASSEPIRGINSSGSAAELIDSRDYVQDEIVSTGDSTVTGKLDFIAGAALPGGETLRLTDAALFRASSTRSFGSLRVGAGIDLLAKQPPMGDNSPFQGASLGARYGLSDSWAFGLAANGGPLLGKTGWYGGAEAHGVGRKDLDRHLYMMGTAGTRGTVLFPDFEGKNPWVLEGLLRGEVVLRERDIAAAWVGSTFGVPMAHSRGAEAVMGAGPIDPQTRLSLHVGFTLSWVDGWDLFADGAVIDRGDAADPETILPILDGGFDQRRLVLGITYRFQEDEKRAVMPMEMSY